MGGCLAHASARGTTGEAAGRHTVPTTVGAVFPTSGRAAACGSWPRRAPRARSPTCADPLASANATPRRWQRDGSPQRPEAVRRILKGNPARSGASSQGEGGPAAATESPL